MAEGNVIPGEMKKKRRQNVACDSCKFRRIKCDLSELLVPDQAGSGSSDGTSVPLAQLVRDNPDVECTNCKNKGVKCTAEQILNPGKPNKGGKRIDEARKRFGGSGAEGSGEGTPVGQGGYEFREQAQVPMQNDSGLEAAPPSTLDHGLGDTGGMDGIEGMDWGAFMNLPGMEDLLAGMDTTVPTMDAQASNPPILDATLDLSTFSFPTDQDSFGVSWDQSGSTTNMNPSLAPASGHAFSAMDPANPHLDFSNDNPVPLYEPSQATATVSSLPTPSSAEQGRAPSRTPDSSAMSDMSKSPYFHQSLVNALGQRDFEAHGIWSDLALGDRGKRTPPPAQAKQSDLGPKFRTGTSPGVVTLDGHTASSPGSSRAPSMPFSFKFDGGPTKFISYDATPKEVLASQTQVFTNKVLNPYATYRPHTNQAPLSMYFQPGQHLIPAGKDAHLAPARKRQRAEFSPSPDSEDPWRLWSDDGRDAHDLVRWGRREVVQQRLADRALGGELSRHLVMAYFHCVHPSFPALSPEGFYLEWERAGKVSERMTPAQEALCAVMEAWGARYSDSPVVLGLSPSRAGMAPKVIQADGTLAPGSQARAHWGKARLAVCNALADRARRLIDNNGLLRTPSVTGLQALLLYNQLLHLTDQRSRAAGQFMENQMVHASIVEQMKLLQLMWDATGDIPVEDGELPITVGQNRMKQRRIFWTVLVSDAFNAAASGDLPKIADEELDSVAQWLSQVEAKLPLSTFKTLAFFMSCYHRITLAARALARKITHPGRRPGTIVVADFCQAVRDCWTQTKSISRDITVITAELLQSCEHSLLGFSPMNYITNLRMSCPFILLVLHQAIREQLDFRKNLRESYIFDESPKSNPSQSSGNSPPGPGSEHVALLEELHLQSVDVLLHSCRSQMEMYKTILPTGMVQTASIFLRVLIASAQFLAEVPTVEQGYPANTLGGYEWTWENKQKEVGTCVEALYQLGWAWADVQEVLDSVLLAMERMTPTEAQLAAYIVSQPSIDERIVVARLVDESNDEILFDRAMQFWPPQSIPAIIEHAMRDLRITDDSTPLSLDAPDAVPWDDLKRISGTRPGNAAPHEIAGSVTSPIGTGSNNSTDPSSRLHALLAAKGHAAHDMAQAADVPWTGGRKVSTNGDAPTTSDRNGTGVSEESRIGGFSEGMVYSASATQGWAMSGSGPPNGSAGSGRSGPTTPQTAPRLRPHGEPQAKKLHLDPDIAFGVVDLSTPQDGSSVGLRSGMASASTGTYFGQDTTRKHDLGPGWTAQPGQYPVAPADDSWNLNDLAGNEWLGFHTPSELGRGVGGVAATGAGATHDAGTLDEGGVDSRSAIDELMRNFEEVTRNGTGYHGPRP